MVTFALMDDDVSLPQCVTPRDAVVYVLSGRTSLDDFLLWCAHNSHEVGLHDGLDAALREFASGDIGVDALYVALSKWCAAEGSGVGVGGGKGQSECVVPDGTEGGVELSPPTRWDALATPTASFSTTSTLFAY